MSIEIINDTYKRSSVKSGTRCNRDEQGKRVRIEGVDQNMVQGNDWLSFFNHIGNKSDLIKVASRFFRQSEIRSNFKTQMIFTEADKTWRITSDEASEIFLCSHEEADTRMVLHACLEDNNVVVVSKDTDVLILLVHAFSIAKPKNDWYMKIDQSKYVEIRKVCMYLGEDICLKLPKIHAVTGCDTTSFFFGVSKIKVLKKIMKDNSKLKWLDSLGESEVLSPEGLSAVTIFIQKVLYNGRESESLVETRIRLYKSMSSQALPPDPDSIVQAIKRVHFQTFFWLRFNDRLPEDIDCSENGWANDGETVVPIWFTGKSF